MRLSTDADRDEERGLATIAAAAGAGVNRAQLDETAEVQADGSEADWATVVEWGPPTGFVLDWKKLVAKAA